MKPRLLLADDHALVLEGLSKLLEAEFAVVGTAPDGRAVVTEAARLRPDVVLLDISMPLLNGIEAARQIKRDLPSAKIVFVTMQAGRDYIREAFQAGASAYVLKQSAGSELSTAIKEAMAGRRYLEPRIAATFSDPAFPLNAATLRAGPLTPRQREVLQLVAEGKSIKEIAAILDISPKTVEFHKASLQSQLGLRTTADVVRYAMERGLA